MRRDGEGGCLDLVCVWAYKEVVEEGVCWKEEVEGERIS